MPFLVGDAIDFAVAQGEEDWANFFDDKNDIFATHRLKSQWRLQMPNVLLTVTNLSHTLFTNAHWEYVDNAEGKTLSGPLSTWPNSTHHVTNQPNAITEIQDRWTLSSTEGTRNYELSLCGMTPGQLQNIPIVLLSDMDLRLRVTYPIALPHFKKSAGVVQEEVRLRADSHLIPGTNRLTLNFAALLLTTNADHQSRTTAVQVVTTFLPRRGQETTMIDNMFFTPSFARFDETRISGLTQEPMVLRGYYSQTFGLNYTLHGPTPAFLFEPGLESGLSPSQLAELAAAGIQCIYAYYDSGMMFPRRDKPTIVLMDFNGQFRPLPAWISSTPRELP